MDWKCNSFDHCMRRLPDPLQLSIALVFIVGLTALKLTVGRSVVLMDFLFIPLVAVGWFASRRWYGYLVATLAAIDTVVVAMLAETQASLAAATASGLARVGLYLAVLWLLGTMRREREEQRREAATDQLTGAANTRCFNRRALDEVERARRYGHGISLAMLDVDGFKHINDTLGHAEGDRALAQASHLMRCTVRASDTVGRVGGDEFAILLPETEGEAAGAVLERVRTELRRITLSDGHRVSFSVGLVSFAAPPASVVEMTTAADELMYRAKKRGRDRMEQTEKAACSSPKRSRVLAPMAERAAID